MLTVVPGDGSGHEGGKDSSSLIDEIVREGARRMLAEALQAEVDAYIAAHAAERDENGRAGRVPGPIAHHGPACRETRRAGMIRRRRAEQDHGAHQVQGACEGLRAPSRVSMRRMSSAVV